MKESAGRVRRVELTVRIASIVVTELAFVEGCVDETRSQDASRSSLDGFDAELPASDSAALADLPLHTLDDSPLATTAEDGSLPDTCVPTPERCNSLDDDCDGRVDEPEDADPSCAVPEGRGTCIAGRCHLAACNADRGDCDRDPSNGCETDLTHTLDHCGACGRRCGGFDACVTGVCGPMTDVDVGLNHSCAVHSTGRVVCWGRNDFGQLGDGTRTDRSRPVLVQALGPASVVRAGDRHSCALSRDRRHVFCWGRQYLGVTPDRTSVLLQPSELIPAVAPPPKMSPPVPTRPFEALFVGSERVIASYGIIHPASIAHTAIWSESAWGNAGSIDGPRTLESATGVPVAWSLIRGSQLYNGERFAEAPYYTEIDASCSRLQVFRSARLELCRSYLLRDDRVAEITVLPERGEITVVLALNDLLSDSQGLPWPTIVDGEPRRSLFVNRLAGGDRRVCCLIRGEAAWHCGMRTEGWVLDLRRRSFLPRAAARLRLFHEGEGGCYLTGGGRVFCWGDNTYGRLGDGTTIARSEPVLVLGR